MIWCDLDRLVDPTVGSAVFQGWHLLHALFYCVKYSIYRTCTVKFPYNSVYYSSMLFVTWQVKHENQTMNSQKTLYASASLASYGVSLVSTVQCCYNAVIHEKHPIPCPPGQGMYGVSFVGSASDQYSASVPAIMCAISCWIRLHSNGTQLYFAEKDILLKHLTVYTWYFTIQHN